MTSTTGMSSSGGAGGGRGGSRRSTKGSVHSLSIDGGDHEVDTLVFIEVGAGTQVPSAAPPAAHSNHATNSLKSCSISSKDSFPTATAAVCTAVAAKTTKQPPFVMPESMPESLDSPEDDGNDRSGHCLNF